MIELIHGDCLEKMKDIESGSIDMILTDPPYGNMKNAPSTWDAEKTAWDKCIPQKELNDECNRVLRTNGTVALFSQEPFTSRMIMQAHNNVPFSYRLVWFKDSFANALGCNKAPVSYTEDICLFFKKHNKHDFDGFHPLRSYAEEVCNFINKTKREIFSDMGSQGLCHFMRYNSTQFNMCTEKTYSELIGLYGIDCMVGFRGFTELTKEDKEYRFNLIEKMTAASPKVFNLPEGARYKSNVLEYKKDYTGLHPTQKPVALIEDLIRAYTNDGDTVLDFTMGSGTTGVACKNLNRDFIGIELNRDYFEIAKKRINETAQEALF